MSCPYQLFVFSTITPVTNTDLWQVYAPSSFEGVVISFYPNATVISKCRIEWCVHCYHRYFQRSNPPDEEDTRNLKWPSRLLLICFLDGIVGPLQRGITNLFDSANSLSKRRVIPKTIKDMASRNGPIRL
jgi:hypothetical protein